MTHMFNTNRHERTYRYYRCVNAVKKGADACTTGSVSAIEIEAFVVEQIKKIGADPILCDATFRQIQTQVAAERRGLKAEAKRIDREVATVRTELDHLTATACRAAGAAADALMAKLAETQERLTTLERRQREIADRQMALDGQDVDPAVVGLCARAVHESVGHPVDSRARADRAPTDGANRIRWAERRAEARVLCHRSVALRHGDCVVNDSATATATLAFTTSSRPRKLHPAAPSREPRAARHLLHAAPATGHR
jgi:hypothetical protein